MQQGLYNFIKINADSEHVVLNYITCLHDHFREMLSFNDTSDDHFRVDRYDAPARAIREREQMMLRWANIPHIFLLASKVEKYYHECNIIH